MQITIFGFIMGLLLLAIPFVLMRIFDSRMQRRLIIAIARMILSMGILGVVLYLLTLYDNVYINILASIIFVIAASIITVARAKLNYRHYLLPVFAGLFASTVILTAYLLLIVMKTTAPLSARTLLPIVGLLAVSSISATADALSSYRSGLLCHARLYYYLVGNGASRAEALYHFVRRALQRATMPAIRAIATLAVVSAPVMTWLMLMNGADVLTAIAFQVVMMAATTASVMFTLIIALLVARRYTIDEYGRLS